MKISRKYRQRIKKRLLTSMSSIMAVLMLIAGSKLVGFSAPEIKYIGTNVRNFVGSVLTVDSSDSRTTTTTENTTINATSSTTDIEDLVYISTAQELLQFATNVNDGTTYEGKTIVLKKDIDLSTIDNWTPIGTSTSMFAGKFQGNGFTINNLKINSSSGIQALFGFNSGTIENLTVTGEVTASGNDVAGICAYNNAGIIQNCTNKVNVVNVNTSSYITGGIVGDNNGGKVINCINYGNISSKYRGVGGIAGFSRNSGFEISGCNNYGTVTSYGDWAAGGIIGYAETSSSGTISNCINESTAIVKVEGGAGCSGGIIGSTLKNSNVTIKNCINNANIIAKVWASGGIIGDLNGITNIYECKNNGEIFAGTGNVGGIVGGFGR